VSLEELMREHAGRLRDAQQGKGGRSLYSIDHFPNVVNGVQHTLLLLEGAACNFQTNPLFF